MTDDGCYARRVKDPDPVRLELARQAVDALMQTLPGPRPPFNSIRHAAEEFGVPVTYILDELERRVRAEQERRDV